VRAGAPVLVRPFLQGFRPVRTVRQLPPSLTENLSQRTRAYPKRILPGQTRPAYAALRQVPGRMPDKPVPFANSPSLVSQPPYCPHRVKALEKRTPPTGSSRYRHFSKAAVPFSLQFQVRATKMLLKYRHFQSAPNGAEAV